MSGSANARFVTAGGNAKATPAMAEKKHTKKRKKGAEMRERGFNLTEVLITMAVIAIIAVIVVPLMFGAQSAATTIRCMADLENFATEVSALAPAGQVPTQEQVRKYIGWGEKYKAYWYVPNNKDFNNGHGNDLDGCDEENPGQSLPGRECIPFRFVIVCTHDTHGNLSDADYLFKLDGLPPQIVARGEVPRTYLQDTKWWPGADPGFDAWIGMVPKK